MSESTQAKPQPDKMRLPSITSHTRTTKNTHTGPRNSAQDQTSPDIPLEHALHHLQQDTCTLVDYEQLFTATF